MNRSILILRYFIEIWTPLKPKNQFDWSDWWEQHTTFCTLT